MKKYILIFYMPVFILASSCASHFHGTRINFPLNGFPKKFNLYAYNAGKASKKITIGENDALYKIIKEWIVENKFTV